MRLAPDKLICRALVPGQVRLPDWGFIIATIGAKAFVQNFFCPSNPATNSPFYRIPASSVRETPSWPEIRRENIVDAFKGLPLRSRYVPFSIATDLRPPKRSQKYPRKGNTVDSSVTAGPCPDTEMRQGNKPKRKTSLYGCRISPTVEAICKRDLIAHI